MTDVQPWPTARGTRSALAAQFGADRADLLAHGLATGDPLADAVVSEMNELGAVVAQGLVRGLSSGLSSIEEPTPAVEALLTATERTDHVDPALIQAGQLPFFSSPDAVHTLSLSAGSLVGGYASANIAATLAVSGRLVDGAEQRLLETAKWLTKAMLPGSLRPGGEGYIATVQVRLLHARMRHRARRQGFDESAHGVPINQLDLARTWMSFTVTSFTAEERLGFGMTLNEQADAYRYWWHLGHLLGIEPAFIEGIESNDGAARVDAMLQAVMAPPSADSVALANATIEADAKGIHDLVHLPKVQGRHILEALVRLFHGDVIADSLGIPRHTETMVLIEASVSAAKRHREHLRRDPAKWAEMCAKNLAVARQSLGTLYADRAEYESVAPAR